MSSPRATRVTFSLEQFLCGGSDNNKKVISRIEREGERDVSVCGEMIYICMCHPSPCIAGNKLFFLQKERETERDFLLYVFMNMKAHHAKQKKIKFAGLRYTYPKSLEMSCGKEKKSNLGNIIT